MMNQEQYMKMQDLRQQGWTIKEIAEETGFHPATISARLASDGPPVRRAVPDGAMVMNAFWRERTATLVGSYPRLLGISVHNKLRAEGFDGGYSTVTRVLREIRGPRFRPAERVSVPIVTDPGEEAQFDFCDLTAWGRRWGWPGSLWCFGMIMCWSRRRVWWFTTSEDRHHTFEGMVRFFEAAGGVPAACRTDRMGALGRSQGQRFVLHAPTVAFAAHHAMTITACRARDAKRKGKVERPFRQLRETFLPELEAGGVPADISELNLAAERWLDERVHGVVSRTTGELPAVREVIERPFLTPLPRVRFDTDYVETRRVHNILPFVHLDGTKYSVPPELLGQRVELRRRVDATRFEIRSAGRLVATHQLATARPGEIIWLPEHRATASATALGRATDTTRANTTCTDNQRADDTGRRHLRIVGPVERLDLGHGDYDVDTPSLEERYNIDGGELA